MRDDYRNSAAKRGYGRKWREARAFYLAKHATCVGMGKDAACTGTATCIDHIKDHHGNASLFWNRRNWQPMCAHCHSTKTAKTMIRPTRDALFDASGMPTDKDHHWNT
jgi:5-methylcytosine-specific restriction protein A